MKKLFLFIAIAAMSISCSSDDDKKSGSADKITFKVGSETKNISNVNVTQEDDMGAPFLVVSGTTGGSNPEVMVFNVFVGEVGEDAASEFAYSSGSQTYFNSYEMTTNVSTNNGSKLVGTFSGTLMSISGTEVTITDGSFNVSY